MFIHSTGEPFLAQVIGNHHSRVLPKAFQWSGEHVQEFQVKWSRTKKPSWSRSRSQYIGSPLNASYAVFFRFAVQFLSLKMCMYGGSMVPRGGGRASLGGGPSSMVGQDGGGGGTLWCRGS